ncbi:MAG: site-2 protease family protein [Candidatus Moranbacteria bacterium]|nr:site-2 protease family protein [Candidatus Moranbacteria bacterium]
MTEVVVLIGFYLIILLYSIIIHEVMHGLAALRLGDLTAKYAGRLTLSPRSHIDPLGSIVVPLGMLLLSGFQFAFGWAKPVPYNPYNLRDQRWGPALVAFAGPVVNIVLALVAAFVGRMVSIPVSLKVDIITGLRVADWEGVSTAVSGSPSAIIFLLCAIVIFWNVLLAFFNLLPIPPLDGSKVLFSFFPISDEKMAIFEQFGFFFLVAFVFLFSGFLSGFLGFFWSVFYRLAL